MWEGRTSLEVPFSQIMFGATPEAATDDCDIQVTDASLVVEDFHVFACGAD